MKQAGDVVFLDVDPVWPIKLLGLAALAWVFFAPLLTAMAARRGSIRRAVHLYAAGSLVAALYFTVLSGDWAHEGLAYRMGVWARHIWAPLLGTSIVLTLISIAVGRFSRRIWPAASER